MSFNSVLRRIEPLRALEHSQNERWSLGRRMTVRSWPSWHGPTTWGDLDLAWFLRWWPARAGVCRAGWRARSGECSIRARTPSRARGAAQQRCIVLPSTMKGSTTPMHNTSSQALRALLISLAWTAVLGFGRPPVHALASGKGIRWARTTTLQTVPSILLGPLAPVSRASSVVLSAAGDDEDEEGADGLRGKDRRALRSLAGRKKAEKSLFTVQQAEPEPSDVWVKELGVALKAHELVNVRALCAPTKKETKRLGEITASRTEAALVQVIGHTYLLYKPGTPPKIDLVALTAPVPPPEKK